MYYKAHFRIQTTWNHVKRGERGKFSTPWNGAGFRLPPPDRVNAELHTNTLFADSRRLARLGAVSHGGSRIDAEEVDRLLTGFTAERNGKMQIHLR